MRDKFLDSQSFCSELERICLSVNSRSKFLRSSVSDNSKYLYTRFENRLRIRTRAKKKLIGLAILSWYLPEEIGVLINLELREIWEESEEFLFPAMLLESKGQMLLFLLETRNYHTRDFFSNIINEEIVKNLLRLVAPVYKTRSKPKRVQRHRGYRDKGTLKLPHEVHELANRTAEVKELEEKRKSSQDSINFLVGWFT